MLFVLGLRPWLHLVFSAGLPSLVLRRLKLLFFGHTTSARRESQAHLSGDVSACALLSSRRPNATVESVAAPRAWRVSTMPALMLSDGSRV
jgi:hypothetical protein